MGIGYILMKENFFNKKKREKKLINVQLHKMLQKLCVRNPFDYTVYGLGI